MRMLKDFMRIIMDCSLRVSLKYTEIKSLSKGNTEHVSNCESAHRSLRKANI